MMPRDGKRSTRRYRLGLRGARSTPEALPAQRTSVKGVGRYAAGRKRAELPPLTERHIEVLQLLSCDEAKGATVIARALSVSKSQAQSALFALQNRGLANREGVGKGWVKSDG